MSGRRSVVGVAVAPSWHGGRGSNFSERERRTRCPPDPQAPSRAPILARRRRDEHLVEGVGRPRPAGRRAGSPDAAGSWTSSPPGLGRRSIRGADAPRNGSRTPLPSRSAQPSPRHLPTSVRAQLGHVNRLRPAPIRGSSVKRMNAAPLRRVALTSAIADVPWQPVRSSVEGPQTKDLGSNETQTGPLKGVSLRAPVGQRQPARIRAAVSGPDCAARRACLRRVQRAATVQETRQRARHDHKRRGRLPVGCRACHRDGNAGNRLQAPRAHRSDPATARDAPRLDLAEPPTPTSPPTVSDR
jgi:hypothetical protein